MAESARINVTAPKLVAAEVKRRAKKTGKSESQVVVQMLEKLIEVEKTKAA